MDSDLSLDMGSLAEAYRSDGGALRPSDVAELVCDRIERIERIERAPAAIWIHRLPRADVLAAARRVEERAGGDPGRLPLYGIPFAIKDNIDVVGLPTTAACPAYGYVAARSAPVVERLVAAGAFLVGKTNMDQLATGLVGVRSPYGIPANPFDARYISGGSSSGSAVAVARGLVSFALGTDTAGSGRVPAGFNNIVGLKPSGGLFSTAGVVPACRSLDCVSVFGLTVDDVCQVADVMAAYDPADAYSRPEADGFRWRTGSGSRAQLAPPPPSFRFGIPDARSLELFGDTEAQGLFDAGIAALVALGGRVVPIDLQPFFAAARLLYDGPWIAERLAPYTELVAQPGALLPVIAEILLEGKHWSAVDLFRAEHELGRLRQVARAVLGSADGGGDSVDLLLVPTSPTIYTIEQIAAEPRKLNARLGLYTNFVNLLGLAGLALPNGFRADGLPSGVTLIGPRDSDARLAAIGAAFERRLAAAAATTTAVTAPATGTLGATGKRAAPRAPSPSPSGAAAPPPPAIRVAVVGAHLAGQPLNYQLTELGARLIRTASTAPHYRLFALPGTVPPKPGLVRAAPADPGAAIELEVWEMPRVRFGDFFARVPPPLAMGTIELDDGERVAGFLCEAHATAGARDISSFGGWRRFLAAGAA